MKLRIILTIILSIALVVLVIALRKRDGDSEHTWSISYVESVWGTPQPSDIVYPQIFGWDRTGTFYANVVSTSGRAQIAIIDRAHQQVCSLPVVGWLTSGWEIDEESGHDIYVITQFSQYGEYNTRSLDLTSWQLTTIVSGACVMSPMSCTPVDPPAVTISDCEHAPSVPEWANYGQR